MKSAVRKQSSVKSVKEVIWERDNDIDMARGALIFYIVFIIHGLYYLKPSWQPVMKSFLLFEMPLLFFISGYSYLLYESSPKGRQASALSIKGYISFIITRLSRILIPYFVYAVFCIMIVLLLGRRKGPGFPEIAVSWLNPFSYGEGYSLGMLNLHLWFIPVLMLVTAVMPLVTRIKMNKKPNLLLLVLGVTIVEYLISGLHFPQDDLFKKSFFYLVFTLLGYYVAKSNNKLFGQLDLWLIAILSLVLLASVSSLKHSTDVLNMQVNKFPPNYLFFIFSCFWVSVFLILSPRLRDTAIKFRKHKISVWLKPFISCGYSIYLWQGVGYTIAFLAGVFFPIPVLGLWVLATALSVVLGVIASPAERIRIKI